jgi:hypothetical protein
MRPQYIVTREKEREITYMVLWRVSHTFSLTTMTLILSVLNF